MALYLQSRAAPTLMSYVTNPLESIKSESRVQPSLNEAKFVKKTDKKYLVFGRLVYRVDTKPGEKAPDFPAGNFQIEITDKLARQTFDVYPDVNGRFKFEYTPKFSTFLKKKINEREFVAKFIHQSNALPGNFLFNLLLKPQGIQEIDLKVKQKDFQNLGDIAINYGFQHLDPSKMEALPYDEVPHTGYLKTFISGRFPELALSLVSANVADILTSFRTSFIKYFCQELGKDKLTALDVQEIFDKKNSNPTPPLDGSSKTLIHELLASVAAQKFDVDPETNEAIWVCNWDKYSKDTPGSVANVEVKAAIDPERKKAPEFTKMTIKYEDRDPWTFTAEDEIKNPTHFKGGVYQALSNFAKKNEAQFHLAAHLVMGLYNFGFKKILKPDHPLMREMAPHFDKVWFINFFGSLGIIFGKNSLLEMAGLSVEGLNALLDDAVGLRVNWVEEKPSEPIADARTDYYGHVRVAMDQEYGNAADAIVNDILKELSRDDNWTQLWLLSEYLHYYDKRIDQFILDKTKPNDNDIENLKKFVKHALIMNHEHDNAHDGQSAVKNIRSLSLAIRDYGLTSDGEFAEDGNTTAEDFLNIKFTAEFITSFSHERILDPNLYVNPHVRAAAQNLVSGVMQFKPEGHPETLNRSIQI